MLDALEYFFRSFYYDTFFNGRVDWVGLVLLAVIAVSLTFLVLFLAWLLALAIYDHFDEVLGTPKQESHGRVMGGGHEPSSLTLIPISNGVGGNTLMPVTTPASYTLMVRIEAVSDTVAIEVNEELYARAKYGDMVTVRYRRGRWSDKLYASIVRYGY